MKLLVATKETQGQRENDFCFCKEGEIVKFGMQCDGEEPDGNCGCARSLCGVDSSSATTTMRVEVIDLTPNKLKNVFKKSLKKEGWAKLMKPKEVEDSCSDMVKAITEVASNFYQGDVIEKRGNDFIRRIVRR